MTPGGGGFPQPRTNFLTNSVPYVNLKGKSESDHRRVLSRFPSRPQDALIACKSKTVQSAFDTLEDCFDYFSKVEPKVKNTAVQKALMSTLLQLEEIEELLDVEEK